MARYTPDNERSRFDRTRRLRMLHNQLILYNVRLY